MTLKVGTRIELDGNIPEIAIIGRWNTTISGLRMEGWHIVKFDDGGALRIHESRFRVISNH